MQWVEVTIHTSNEAMEPISNFLNEMGANGTVIEDPADLVKENIQMFGELYALDPRDYPADGILIKAYFSNNAQVHDKVSGIKDYFKTLEQIGFRLGAKKISLKEIKEDDWANAWKKFYKPVQITNRITIVPSWEKYAPKTDEEQIIELDPGMAFGTGTHPTTILSIKALEKYVSNNNIVLDVGCGSGILSIVAAKLGAQNIYAYDLDEVAVRSTRTNVAMNGVEHRVEVKQNDLLNGVEKRADIIVSNILAEIIVKFTDKAWDNLRNNGLFITSGIIAKKEQQVKEHLIKNKFHIAEKHEMNGWISLVAIKVE
ncbi:50S ribosomal protein L11 methyltransferase [Virgibacillus sp. W0430]|uniref:50S ribosomal protein L11 methyltransferase n=1 Tax=Virgibacillus sp. W0430 TaxID=3391580 RepID=UPI003F48AFDA